jgi:hypothetical protein
MILSLYIALILFSWLFIFFGGFGTVLILIFSLIYALLTGFEIITAKVLIALTLLCLAGEVFDYVFVYLGTKIGGASKKAAWGAIMGGLIGAAVSLVSYGVGLIPLTLVGIFLGAFVVELNEKKDVLKALKAGLGSLVGRFSAVLFKALLGIVIVGIIFYHIWAGYK